MHFEKPVSVSRVFSGRIVDVYHDTVELENGKRATREKCLHNGGACVLAVDNGEVILVEQYRYAVSKALLELPAGKLEKGEEPGCAALREMREETGMQLLNMVKLGEIYPSPGILSECIHIYFASEMDFRGESPDEDEFVSVKRVKLTDFCGMITGGEITDAKTLCAFTLAKAKGLI